MDVDVSTDAFESVFGQPPDAAAFARGWTTVGVQDAFRRRGINLDLGVIPAISTIRRQREVPIKAVIPDTSTVPITPYVASNEDWRRSASTSTSGKSSEPRGPVVVPLTNTPIGAWMSMLSRLHPRDASAADLHITHHAFLRGVLQPRFVRAMRRGPLSQRPYITLSARSNRLSGFSDADMVRIADRIVEAEDGQLAVTTAKASRHVVDLLATV
jgi:hypothetical protein